MHLKMFTKWGPFCRGLNMLTTLKYVIMNTTGEMIIIYDKVVWELVYPHNVSEIRAWISNYVLYLSVEGNHQSML